MAKYIVAHKRLFLAVKGVLQHFPAGTEVNMDPEQAAKLGAKLVDPSNAKKMEVSGKDKSDKGSKSGN